MLNHWKPIAGGGAWLIAVALAVTSQVWPNILKPHPWAVGALVVVGALMFVFAALGHKQASGAGIQTGRDNSGHNVVAGRDVYIGSQAPPPAPLPALDDDLKPILRTRSPKKLYLESSSCIFKHTSSSAGLLGLIIPIENMEAETGQRATDALKIVALLRFYKDEKECGTIQRAYWMNREENQVTIPIGESKFVVMGSYEPGG
jgi:hypothetical protein